MSSTVLDISPSILASLKTELEQSLVAAKIQANKLKLKASD